MKPRNKNIPAKTRLQQDKTEGESHRLFVLFMVLLIGISAGMLNLSVRAEENHDLGYYYLEVSSLIRYIGNFEYPSINPDLHFGFFNAYYPLAYFIPSILTLITGNIFFAHGLSRILVSLFCAISFYIVCRYEKIDTRTGLILTFLYVYSIYFLALLKGSFGWAGAFIFMPLAVYSLYKVFHGEKEFEILLIISGTGLALISLAPFVHLIYFFIIYFFILLISGKKSQDIIKGAGNLFIPFLFIGGLSFFYLFFVGTTGEEMAFNKLLQTYNFAATPEVFSNSGIDFVSLFYVTERNFTTIGFLPFILLILSIFIRPFSKMSGFERYLLLILTLSLLVSLFPFFFVYLPVVKNTEAGFRALVIGCFSLLVLSRHAVDYLNKKLSYSVVFGIVIVVTLSQLYFTPEYIYMNKKLDYSDDIKDFYSVIQKENGIVRVNYPITLNYPLCGNCIAFGASHNRFAITRDESTTNLWGYVDFAQRNPADIKTNGVLGEKYLIIQKELSPGYIEKGYIPKKDGERLSLLQNPYSTSIFQLISENVSTDLVVYREGSRFKTNFEAKNDGFLLIKLAYHPLAEVSDNGEKAEVGEAGYGIMYVALKKGTHDIVFRYKNYNYYYVTLLSIAVFLFYCNKKKYVKTLLQPLIE